MATNREHDIRVDSEIDLIEPAVYFSQYDSFNNTEISFEEEVDNDPDFEGDELENEDTLDGVIDDPVSLYLKQMAQTPLLSADEEIQLAKMMESGMRLNKQ